MPPWTPCMTSAMSRRSRRPRCIPPFRRTTDTSRGSAGIAGVQVRAALTFGVGGMIHGMTTVKRAVTIDEELEREARALAGENFSAFVSEAVSRHVRRLKLEQLVRADEAERGPVDAKVQAQVETDLALLDEDDRVASKP